MMSTQSEINDLKTRLQNLEAQQKKCSHDWGEQKYNPYTMKEEQSTGRYEIQGIHMNPISTYIDITMPRWSRMVKKCGSIQHTEAQRQVITYVPDFK